jgi:hypothetical protein
MWHFSVVARKDETLNANISVENSCIGTKRSKQGPGHQDLSIDTNIPSKKCFLNLTDKGKNLSCKNFA